MGAQVARSGSGSDRLSALMLLSPAYLWLMVAVFLPLSAMAFFSFLTDVPFGGRVWQGPLGNYAAFFETGTYALLLGKSIRLALIVTAVCVVAGFPCAWVLAKMIRGRAREAVFLLVILPFWSNALVRVFSWAIVLRGNGVLERAVNALLPWDVKLGLAYSQSAIVIGPVKIVLAPPLPLILSLSKEQ